MHHYHPIMPGETEERDLDISVPIIVSKIKFE
jgi:hypothetical protein